MTNGRLEIDFAGIQFKNPFMLSSAPPSMNPRLVTRAARLGWGGTVLKTVTESPTVDPRTRLGALRKDGKLIGMNNIELLSRETVDTWINSYIPKMKSDSPEDFVLIASIMSSPEPEGWTALAEKFSVPGIKGIELNVSCPHGSPEKHMGAFIGQNADLVENVTRAAKKGTDLPLLVKLTPNVTDVVPIAQAAKKGGADGVSAINTVESLIGIDVETATPMPQAFPSKPGESLSTYGGFCGPAVRPIGLRIVSQIARGVPDLLISGIGGIEDWYSAAEYLMVGAGTLQVCTAAMWHGFGIIKDMTSGLEGFMSRKGYENLDSMVGVALPKLTTWEALDKLPPVVAKITDACTGCKKCVIACADGGYVAIQMRDGKAVVNAEKCDGCGLCYVVCDDRAVDFVYNG
ncbi:MAG: NAD-dependent dihydropyrimidine dehydrogenase subunit PreA [Candidatus Thorarchaeota archaeon]|nr:NAD-dependent dihydropyrimidine dehydrogenase subunit PreA [Candidatus Thorarchaeota archaeon]